MVTTERLALVRAIAKYRASASYCGRIDEEIAAKESTFFKNAARDRQEATKALETARRYNPTPQQKALSALLQTVERPVQTVEQAEAALAGLQSEHDAAYEEIDLAKREANRIRNSDLLAAERQRDNAVGRVLESEHLISDLLRRYDETRKELSRLYLGILALPLAVRPGGWWQSAISLNELQTGDKSLANTIKDCVAALQSDADAPLPNSPAPAPPEADAEAA